MVSLYHKKMVTGISKVSVDCSEWALEGSQRWRIASQHMAGVRGDIADIGGAKHQ